MIYLIISAVGYVFGLVYVFNAYNPSIKIEKSREDVEECLNCLVDNIKLHRQ